MFIATPNHCNFHLLDTAQKLDGDTPVPVLIEKLDPEGSYWPTGVMLLTVFVIFFIHIYQSAVVLDTGGLCTGSLI